MKLRHLLLSALCAAAFPAAAQTDSLKIGFITDMSSLYADISSLILS